MYSSCMAASCNILSTAEASEFTTISSFLSGSVSLYLYMEDCKSKADAALLIDITTEKCFALLLNKKDKELCACWHGLISAAALGSYVS